MLPPWSSPLRRLFPSDDGIPELCGGIWGFGVFNNGDDAKIAAAKTFIDFVSNDKTQGPASVYATGFFPVRASFGDVYAGTEKAANSEFLTFMPYLGDYYNVTGGLGSAAHRMVGNAAKIFAGEDVTAANAYADASNAGI